MKEHITKSTHETLIRIRRHWKMHGRAPRIEDIRGRISAYSICSDLKILEHRGYILPRDTDKSIVPVEVARLIKRNLKLDLEKDDMW